MRLRAWGRIDISRKPLREAATSRRIVVPGGVLCLNRRYCSKSGNAGALSEVLSEAKTNREP